MADDEFVRKFIQGNVETFQELLEDKFNHIVLKIDPMGELHCIYRYFIQKTETENFLKCLNILSEFGLKHFEKDATVANMKICIPQKSTLEWIDAELNKNKGNDGLDHTLKKYMQANPLLKSTVNKGFSILFTRNTNDVEVVTDLLKSMQLDQFMDVLQSCTENILETSLFLTDEELLENLRKDTSYGTGKIIDEVDGIFEVHLKFGVCFLPDPTKDWDNRGGSHLESMESTPPPDDSPMAGGSMLPAHSLASLIPTAAGTPAPYEIVEKEEVIELPAVSAEAMAEESDEAEEQNMQSDEPEEVIPVRTAIKRPPAVSGYQVGVYEMLADVQTQRTPHRDGGTCESLKTGELVNVLEIRVVEDRIRGRLNRGGWLSLASTETRMWVWAKRVRDLPADLWDKITGATPATSRAEPPRLTRPLSYGLVRDIFISPKLTENAEEEEEDEDESETYHDGVVCFCLELLLKLKQVFNERQYTWYRNHSWLPSLENLTNPPKPLRQSVILNSFKIQHLLMQLLENEEIVRFHSMVKTDHWEVIIPILPEVGILDTLSPDTLYKYPSVLYVDISFSGEVQGLKFFMSNKQEVVCESPKWRRLCNYNQRFNLDDDEWITQIRCHVANSGEWRAVQFITNRDRRSKLYGKKEGILRQFGVSDTEGIYSIDVAQSEPTAVKSNPCVLHLLGKDLIRECADTTDGNLQQLACEAIGHIDYYSMQIWNELLYRCLHSENLLYWTLSTLNNTGFWKDIWKRTNSEKPCDFMRRVITTQSVGQDTKERWRKLAQPHREECLADMQRCFKAFLYGENIFPGSLRDKANEWKISDALPASQIEIWETVEHLEGNEIILLCKDLIVYWLKLAMPSLVESDCIAGFASDGKVRKFVKEMIKHALIDKSEPISAKEIQEYLEKRQYSQEKAEKYVSQLYRFLRKNITDTIEFMNLFPIIDVMGSDDEKLEKLKGIGFDQPLSFFQAVTGLSEIVPELVHVDGEVKTKHIKCKDVVKVNLDRRFRNSLFIFEIDFHGSEDPVRFKVVTEGDVVKFDEEIYSFDNRKGVCLLQNCSELTLSMEAKGTKKDEFIALWKNPILVPIISEDNAEFSPKLVRFQDNKTKEFVKADDKSDFDAQTLFKLKPLQCVDQKWHCQVSLAKSSVGTVEVEVTVQHSGHDQADGVFTKKKLGEIQYWKKVNQDLSFGLVPDFDKKIWHLVQQKSGVRRIIQVNRNLSEISEIPPAAGWMYFTDPQKTPYTVPWASVNIQTAQQLSNVSDGWSFDNSSIPCHCIIKFDKVIEIKEVTVKNGFPDHDCAKELSIVALEGKTVEEGHNWAAQNSPWDVSNRWTFTSEKSTKAQSFVPPSTLPKSQYFKFTIHDTYGGYPFLKSLWFDTEQEESMSDMTVSVEKSVHVQYFEQRKPPKENSSKQMEVCDFSNIIGYESLDVFASPTDLSEVIEQVRSGTVEVTEQQDDWFQISYNHCTGWVQKRIPGETWDTLLPLPSSTKKIPDIIILNPTKDGYEVTGSDGKPIFDSTSTFTIYDEYNSIDSMGAVREAFKNVFIGETRIQETILEFTYIPEIQQGWDWLYAQKVFAASFTDEDVLQSLIATNFPRDILDQAYSFSEQLVLHTGMSGNKHFVEWAKPGAEYGDAFLEVEVETSKCLTLESDWSSTDDDWLLLTFLAFVDKDRKKRHLSNIALNFPNVSKTFILTRMRFLLERFSGQVLYEGDKVICLKDDSLEIDFEGHIHRTHERTHEIKALKKITKYDYVSEQYGYIHLKASSDLVLEPSSARKEARISLKSPEEDSKNPLRLWQYDGTYIRNKEKPVLVLQCESIEDGANLKLSTAADEHRTLQQWDFDGSVFRLRYSNVYCLSVDETDDTKTVQLKTFESSPNQEFVHGISRGGLVVGQKIQLRDQKATVQQIEEDGNMIVVLETPVEKSEDLLVCLNPKLVTLQLMKICKEGGQKSVYKLKKLMELSEEIEDGIDKEGCTSLILAVKHGHRDIIDILLEYETLKNRFDINWKDNSGLTAYMHAKQKGLVGIMEAFLAKGAEDLSLPVGMDSILVEHVFESKPVGFKVDKGMGGVAISGFTKDDLESVLEVGWKLVRINDKFVEKSEIEDVVKKIAEEECPLRILFRRKEESKKKKKKSQTEFDPLDFKVGDKTECLYTINGNYYACAIDTINSDGTFNVIWDDGDTKDRKDHPREHLKPLARPVLCLKGHRMELTRGLPPKPNGGLYDSVVCDGCRATGLENKSDFYHCTPCAVDFCKECGLKRSLNQCMRCASDIKFIHNREQLIAYNEEYRNGYQCNMCNSSTTSTMAFPMWHCPNPSGGEKGAPCQWDACTNCIAVKAEKPKVYVETITFSNTMGKFELCFDEDKQWVYKKEGAERIVNCGFQLEDNGTIHVCGRPVGPWPGADSVKVLPGDKESIFSRLWNHPEQIRMLARKTKQPVEVTSAMRCLGDANIPLYLQGGAVKCSPGNQIRLETRTPSLVYIGLEDHKPWSDDEWGYITNVNGFNIYCRFLDSPLRIELPSFTTMVVVQSMNVEDILSKCIQLGKESSPGWNRFFSLPSANDIGGLSPRFMRKLRENERVHQNGLLYERLMECENMDWCDHTIPELDDALGLGPGLLNAIICDRLRRKRFDDAPHMLAELCKKTLEEVKVDQNSEFQNNGWKYFDLKIEDDIIVSKDLKENLYSISNQFKSESFRPHLKSLMKYENLEGLQNVEEQVDFLDFMTHFHEDNLVLLSSLEFIRTARLVFSTLKDWTGECSVLLGNRWYSASVKGLNPEGQIEVFCKNDTESRLINFNQLRLARPTPQFFGEEKVVCSYMEPDSDITKSWYRGVLRELGEKAIVDREPKANNYAAVLEVSGSGYYAGTYYRSDRKVQNRFFYEKLSSPSDQKRGPEDSSKEQYCIYYVANQWRLSSRGRAFLKDPTSAYEAFVVDSALQPEKIKNMWMLVNNMDLELEEPELQIKVAKEKDKSVFHLDEESFWTCKDNQKQQVFWSDDKGRFEVMNLNKGYIWANLEVHEDNLTLHQIKMLNMFCDSYEGTRNDVAGEYGFEFTAKQTFVVKRLGRSFQGEKLSNSAVVTLWDVEKTSAVLAMNVGPEAEVTEQCPGWMSVDVSSFNKKCEKGKKYRLTLRATVGMNDKWRDEGSLSEKGVESEFVEIGPGCRSKDANGGFPSCIEGENKYLGNVTIFFEKEMIYKGKVEGGEILWDDSDVWSPHATMQMMFDPICLRLADAVLPRDKNGKEMRRCIGKVEVSENIEYRCSWCSRGSIEKIDQYYHFSLETAEVLCYQCYNDRTDYVPLASQTIDNAKLKPFRDLWTTCAYEPKVPPLFPKLKKLLADDTTYRKGPYSYVGSLDTLRDEVTKDAIALSPQGESILQSIFKEHSKLVELENIARFRRALQRCEYEELVSISDIKILETIDFDTVLVVPESILASLDMPIDPETKLRCLRYVQAKLLKEITGEELEDSKIGAPGKAQKEIQTIQDLVKLAKQLKEDPEADPPKVISSTVRNTLRRLFATETLEFDSDKIWLDSLSYILNSNLIKTLLTLPDSYAQALMKWFFKDRPDEDEKLEGPPILRSPTLQRMRTFTKVVSLDLGDEKVKQMAQDQAQLFAEVAKNMDLHTLLELVRKDVHGFGLKGIEPNFSKNILTVVIQAYNKYPEALRPPKSIYDNVLVNIIDRLIEMQLWDEIKYTISNVSYPDSIKEKIHSYELVMKLKSNVNGPDIIQKILLNEVTSLNDVRSILVEIKNGDAENITKLLSLPHEHRKHMIVLFDSDEIDYNVDCPICFSLPALQELPCKHKICTNCVKALKTSYQNRCPFCRAKIS